MSPSHPFTHLAASFLALAGGSLCAAVPTFTSNATVHDPAVLRAGDTYYVYGSHFASAKTTDLMNWTQLSTSAQPPNVLVPNPQTEFAECLAWASTTTFWAPDVFRLQDGTFAYYYCACKGDSPRSALGIAEANNPEGDYANAGLLLKSGMWGQVSPDGKIYDNAIHPNTVDPSLFNDAEGRLWMVYGSYSGGIFVMQLDPLTGVPYPNQGYGKKIIGGNNTTIEGPCIFYNPDTGYYYLLMTYGGLDANGGYNLRLGRATSPTGPYRDAAGNDLTPVAGRVGTLFDNASIAPYGVKLAGNHQFNRVSGEPGTLQRGYLSPGGASVYFDKDRGRWLVFMHTRFVGRGEQHEVRVQQLYFNRDGWPVLAPHRFAHEALAPVIAENLPGDYKIIDHGKDVTSTVKFSTVSTLQADGTVTGARTGTWMTTAPAGITVTLAGKVYEGVWSKQWDDDTQRWVQCFSAVASDGTCVWGSRVASATANTAPEFQQQPTSAVLTEGAAHTLSAQATGGGNLRYQWKRNGKALAGATSAQLAIVSFSPAQAGGYTVVAYDDHGSTESAVATLSFASPNTAEGRPINLSLRGVAGQGDATLIAGFSIQGSGQKTVLVRASGPALAAFPGTNPMPDPALVIYDGAQNVVLRNDNWDASLASTASASGAFAWTAGSLDAAVLVTLAPGNYTVHVVNGSTGSTTDKEALIEIYDVSRDIASSLGNLSCRVQQTTNPPLILGTVLDKGVPLLIRNGGPSLKALGVGTAADDTRLAVFNQSSAQIGANDDWDPALAPTFATLGAYGYGTSTKDAALLLMSPPQALTVHASTVGAAGIGIVELYLARQLNPL